MNFDQNNIGDIELPILAQNTSPSNEHFSQVNETRRNSGLIQLGFFGEESCWEYVSEYSIDQLEVINFIKENQKEILQSIFDYTTNKLYPEHIGYIGYDEVSFPKLNQITDLRKALGVNLISIYYENAEGTAYYGLTCDFSGDFEHGINIIMNKTTVLGWEENMGKELVLNDLKK